MKSYALLVLGLAVSIAAQTAPLMQPQRQEPQPSADQLFEKLQAALQNGSGNAERAQAAAMEYRERMKGKSAAETRELGEEYRAQINQRMQNAVDALEPVSANVKEQVTQVQERIQSRMQARKSELSELQQKIHPQSHD
jgi:gas vesicle protein